MDWKNKNKVLDKEIGIMSCVSIYVVSLISAMAKKPAYCFLRKRTSHGTLNDILPAEQFNFHEKGDDQWTKWHCSKTAWVILTEMDCDLYLILQAFTTVQSLKKKKKIILFSSFFVLSGDGKPYHYV